MNLIFKSGWLLCLSFVLLCSSCEKEDTNDDVILPGNTGQTDNSDSGEGVESDAPYARYAVKYILTENCDIYSIELTASGTYLIMPSESDFRDISTEALSQNLFGYYTPADDGSCVLEDFGTIKPVDATNLDVKREGETEFRTMSVRTIVNKNKDVQTDRIARTWYIAKVEELVLEDGRAYTRELSEAEIRENYVKYMQISCICENDDFIGSFFRVSHEGHTSGGYWYWTDKNKDEVVYIFVENGRLTSDTGRVKVSFEDDYAVFREGPRYTIKCKELKR